MTFAKLLSVVNRGILCCAVFGILFTQNAARGQSPVVFMTYDNSGGQSRLARFNLGVESFSVGLGAGAAFQGVTIHTNGNVLIADYVGEKIQRFHPNGAYLGAFASFSDPTYLEADSGGNVYTTHGPIGAAGVTRFNAAGAVTQTYFEAGMTGSYGVDADAAGNVYVADNPGVNSRLYKFAANGTFLNSVPIGGTVSDLAVDEAGQRLFVTLDSGLANAVREFNISGATPTFTGNRTSPAGAGINGIQYASQSGHLFLTDFGAVSGDPRGLEYSPTGTLLWTYRPSNPFLAFDITAFAIPEPTSLVLLMLGLATACAGGRTRRRR